MSEPAGRSSAAAPAAVAGSARRRRRAVLTAVLAVAALVAATLLAGPPAGDDGPLDPRSAGPNGLRGLVDLAERFGQQVDTEAKLPVDRSTTLLLVRDHLGAEGRQRVRRWVERGGRLVVADPTSPLHGLEVGGEPVTDLLGPSRRTPDCPLAGLAEVGQVGHAGWRAYRVPDDATGCFPGAAGEAWLVARAVGDGEVVALGSAGPLLNRSLGRDDNAVLAAALLFPDERGAVRILPPDPAALAQGLGDTARPEDAVADLLPETLVGTLVLLALATLLLVLAVGRRLGRPVAERLPPTLPSAELARSVGELLQRAGSRRGASGRLRADARAEVARVLGADPAAPEQLARLATARLHLAPEVARLALLDLPVDHDDALVEVARATAEVRERLTAVS